MLEWGMLIICSLVLLLRLPDAVRGRNRAVFGILFIATLCSLLAIPGPYEAIDGVLGGWNLANLLQRLLVFAAVLLVGLRISRALGDEPGHRRIGGPPGRWVLAAACLALAACFFLMDTRGSSAGLLGVADAGGRNSVLAPIYAAVARSYPAFVSLVLLPALLSAARSRLPRLVRAGALLMVLGALATAVSVPLSFAADGWSYIQLGFNIAAVLGYVLGLAVFWFSGLIAHASSNATATIRNSGI